MMRLLAECQGHCSMVQSYVGLMTDLPHILFEFSLEILTAPIAFVIGKRFARREHRRIDAEHGVRHPSKDV